ncbi:MAG: pyruvate:ferredoxin (flavodoxin) oxidoreductase [Oscillospiraceae bacterium]|nr:pyruvate:ferredoxin (flavodoxin) oxidoreductase [Oscillospiraceae bacterium]
MRKLKTMDGNAAAAHVAYAFSEVAAIYPITPSSVMAEHVDEWSADGKLNIFDQPVKVVEMQSEGGAAGAVHGSLMSGSFTTTFTASQGLLLMIPNMYKIAGELTPSVIHVAARALATHALSIFGDHSDVMSCRSTGYAMLASTNPQEVMDLAAVAHLATISGRVPVMHFFDGFRTSHEQQKVAVWDYADLKEMVDWDAVAAFRARANVPAHPVNKGSSEPPEIFFQHKEAANKYYLEMPDVVAANMEKVNRKLGTNYKPFNYYGAEDATEVIVAMGSVCDAIEEVVDYLNAQGKKTGLVKVRLYRPFSQKHLLEALPKTVKRIAVLDRCKEPGSVGEPLYLDIAASLRGTEFADVLLVGGRYGLGSKDTQPGDLVAVYENLWSEQPKNGFTISIVDDVTNLSLPVTSNPDTTAAGTVSCKFWGLGSDGTVGANKNSIKIIGDHTDKKVQAYFQYDSKKSGGVTISHLRFGDNPIKSTYYVTQADFVACHNPAYIKKYDIVQDVKPNGHFLLNCSWNDAELDEQLPAACKRYIAQNNIKFYTCDAISIAKRIGLGGRTNTILQSAFFKLTGILPIEEAVGYMEDAIRKTYGKKGEKVVNMNIEAVAAGVDSLHEVRIPASWATAEDTADNAAAAQGSSFLEKYVNTIQKPVNSMRGDSLPVSAFMDTVDGTLPSGSAAFEKRGIAVDVPQWLPENCMQCNWCSYVCPHAAIRPVAMTIQEALDAGVPSLPMKGDGCEDMRFAISISNLDCTGCGSCISVCPARKKALEPVAAAKVENQQKFFDYAVNSVSDKELPFALDSIKGSQFKTPLLEFSGACPGCGESPYAKLITQLFGDRMLIANATGCSSIWGCSAPSTPYTVNKQGRGPAWSNSLFEDNAEYGLGMAVSMKQRRAGLANVVKRLAENAAFAEAANNWLNGMDDAKTAETAGNALLELCKANTNNSDAKYVADNADLLIKPSVWIFGGDGWAYDIGYGGLDHVLASGENVNIVVFDTEVYSNTGGQSSKATPLGATAKFAAAGKAVKKKDLASIAMSYGYVYVAQVAMGANPYQTLRAITEAESYDGPSLIICYAPCINHGIKAGMNKSMLQMKNAVLAGYWNLLRFDPRMTEQGKNPLAIDSTAPTAGYKDFLMGEVRYNALALKNPQRAEELFQQAEKAAKDRYDELRRKKKSLETPLDEEE